MFPLVYSLHTPCLHTATILCRNIPRTAALISVLDEKGFLDLIFSREEFQASSRRGALKKVIGPLFTYRYHAMHHWSFSRLIKELEA